MSGSVMFERFLPATTPLAMIPISCPQCGVHVSLPSSDGSNQRILELESQVKILNSKAAAAVDRLADYEDEVKSLRDQCARLQQSTRSQTPQFDNLEVIRPASAQGLHSSPPRAPSRLASLSSFLPTRRNLQNGTMLPSNLGLNSPPGKDDLATQPILTDPNKLQAPSRSQSPNLQSLETSLEKERTLRLQAESSLTQTQSEIEELTASLFGQANEMVATERKARAKLEERVKMLETRDVDKRRRLDRLEQALKRIERVRGLVAQQPTFHVVEDETMSEDVQQQQVNGQEKENRDSADDQRRQRTDSE